MARPLPIACATLLSIFTLGSLAIADDAKDAKKKEEPKKEEKKDEKKEEAKDEPTPSTDESKAEHPAETPKAPVADDEKKYDWRKEEGGEHGSQVASSEWLPISIGAAAGVMIGALAGAAFDDSQPPLAGPLLGGIAGGFAGGAGGAWLIRAQREKDTRVAGTVSGLAIGVGMGALIYAKIDADGRALETIGKYGALVITPLIGAVAGHALAAHFYLRPPRESTPAPTAIIPSVSPVITGSHGATGMTFGIDAFF